jgi:hypothetical protein
MTALYQFHASKATATRELAALAAGLGYHVRRTTRGHLRCQWSDGAVVFVGATSDVRGLLNAVTRLKRVARQRAGA